MTDFFLLGYIKTHYKEFLHHVQIEMDQHLWIVGKRTNSLPILKLHNVPGIQGKKQKTSELGNNNGFENGRLLSINCNDFNSIAMSKIRFIRIYS